MQLRRKAREIPLSEQARGWLDSWWGRTVKCEIHGMEQRRRKAGRSTFQEKPKRECILIS